MKQKHAVNISWVTATLPELNMGHVCLTKFKTILRKICRFLVMQLHRFPGKVRKLLAKRQKYIPMPSVYCLASSYLNSWKQLLSDFPFFP